MTKRPISIYVHIPFCVKKCNYCDFLSAESTADERSVYISALLSEIASDRGCDEYIVKTVFFGGGTPSILDVSELEKILCKLKEKYEFLPKAEITLECNPGTVREDWFINLKRAGVNRLSMGVQSFDDKELKVLGRIHNSDMIYKTYDAARKAGFDNINLDIMSSLPGQDVESFKNTLNKAIELMPEHLSVYSLIIEPQTPFFEMADELELPDEDTELKIDSITKQLLKEAGYERYEVSNYAKAGYECKHNITYWERGEYRGYGLGAASLLRKNGTEFRFGAERKMSEYLAYADKTLEERISAEEFCVLDLEERQEETVFLGLRMTKGFCIDDFEGDFCAQYMDVVNEHIKNGLTEFYLCNGQKFYRLTERGMDISNPVMAEYLLSV